MDFKIRYTVHIDKDHNMFQRKHFERLHTLLRIDENGNHLESTDFEGAKLKNLDLSGLDLSNFNFNKARLKNVDFSNCNLTGTTFEKALLESCNFQQVKFRTGSLFHAKAKLCDFSDSELCDMKWLEPENCTFQNVKFCGAVQGIDFSTCKMENNNYENAYALSGLIFPNDAYLP